MEVGHVIKVEVGVGVKGGVGVKVGIEVGAVIVGAKVGLDENDF